MKGFCQTELNATVSATINIAYWFVRGPVPLWGLDMCYVDGWPTYWHALRLARPLCLREARR